MTKLNASGSQLVYSTRVGGVEGKGIAVDFNGDAWVTGRTSTPNFPTVNAFQAVFGGVSDAFVAELNATGSAFLYWSYLGGSGFDWGSGIALDNTGNPSVAGTTDSLNFPTVNPYRSTNSGGRDIFVAKLNSTGTALLYSTYIGGSGDELGFGNWNIS